LCFVREGSLGRDVDALTARVAALDVGPSLRAPSGDAPVGDDLGPDTVRTGVDAMLRHVVPYAQQRMKNRDLLVRTAVDVLGPDDWLRHVSAGRSPGRDSGSGVVVVTEAAVTVANLNSRFAIADSDSVLLDEVSAVPANEPALRRLGSKWGGRGVREPDQDPYVHGLAESAHLHSQFLLLSELRQAARRFPLKGSH
jgi:hypothetical protein